MTTLAAELRDAIARALASPPQHFECTGDPPTTRRSPLIGATSAIQVSGLNGWFYAIESETACAANETARLVVWAPRRLPALRSLAIVSSRIGRRPDQHPDWIDALRTSVCYCNPQTDVLLIASGTTTAPWLERLGMLLTIPRIEIQWMPKRVDSEWFTQMATSGTIPSKWTAYAFRLARDDSSCDGTSEIQQVPDYLPIVLAIEVRVLFVRRDGHIQQLVRHRLQQRTQPPLLTFLLHSTSTPHDVGSELIGRGATSWLLQPPATDAKPAPIIRTPVATQHKQAESLDVASIPWSDYLSHATRAPLRPYRPENDDAYFDRLLFGDHRFVGELANLIRILAGGRIHGSRHLIRGQQPVVCFTAQPLERFASLRIFRPHLGRWDFEPFGIAIRRERLIALGARPVIYGDDALWRELPEDDRPFFQMAQSRRGNRIVDWSVEREWRIVEDLDLKQVSIDDAVVFVARSTQIPVVMPFSRWPVVAIDDNFRSASQQDPFDSRQQQII